MLVLHNFTFRSLLAGLQRIAGIRNQYLTLTVHIEKAFTAGKAGKVPDGGISLDKNARYLLLFQKGT